MLLDASAPVALTVLTRSFGGLHTLALRRAAWLRRRGHRVLLVFRSDTLSMVRATSGQADVLAVHPAQADPDCASALEFCGLADKIRGWAQADRQLITEAYEPWGLALASMVAARNESKVLVGLMHPYTFGGWDGLSRLQQASCLYAMNQACVHGLRGVPLVPLTVSSVPKTCPASAPQPLRGQVLTVARLEPMKGYVFGLLLALLELRRRLPHATLTVVGDGPLRRPLTAEVRRLGLDSAVVWAGTQSPQELGRYYEECEVFVGMGTAALEAAAAGRATLLAFMDQVALSSPGFLHEAPGLTVGERTETGVQCDGTDLLLKAYGGNKVADMGRKCWAHVRANFSEDDAMEKWLTIAAGAVRMSGIPLFAPPLGRGGELRRLGKRLASRYVALDRAMESVRRWRREGNV